MRVLGCCFLLYFLAVVQDPGRISRDTKLDLYVDPGAFLSRALSLWDGSSAFGQLQNQAYGYLFPMGPFFWLTHLLHIEPWMAQRLWMGSLMTVAFLGIYVLAGRLGLGTPLTRVIAAFAFALTPRLATTLGPISSEALPMCVAPWVLVPLVRASRQGDVRRAAAWSGLAVACTGAVNAVATLAVLPLPALFLLTRSRGPRRRSLLLWWSVAIVLAATWWIIPLLTLGSYSFPFLDYIETSRITTAETSLVEVMRGASHWLGGLVAEGEPWWRAAWLIETGPFVVLASVVVAALGLVGVARRDNPERIFLLLGVTLGCVIVGFGYAGPSGAVFAGQERELLDGVLAPFRNIHKFDVVLRVPLVLGLAHLLAVRPRHLSSSLTRLAACCAVIVTAMPFLIAQIEPTGGYRSLPLYWRQAADWLSAHAGDESTLLLPAAGFGEYYWGRPMDDPMQPLARAPWAVRNQVPLGSEGSTRLLDSVQAVVTDGRGSAGLSEVLARSGVRYLLVRNDLDYARTSAPPPAVVHQALERSPGIRRVATFGPGVAAAPVGNQQVSDYALDALNPAVEIYRVAGADARTSTYDASRITSLDGGPDSLMAMADVGLLSGRPVVVDGDPESRAVRSRSVILSDDLRKRRRNYGTVYDGATATLSAGDPADRKPLDLLPWPGVARSAAHWTGIRDLRVSSSASDTDAFVIRGPEYSPAAAVDGDSDSAWVTGSTGAADDQWFDVRLFRRRDVSSVAVRVLDSAVLGAQLSAVQVVTDHGSAITRLADTESLQQLRVPAGPTSRVRLNLTGVRRLRSGPVAVGLREVSIDGVSIGRTITVPRPRARVPTDAILLSTSPGERWGCAREHNSTACSPRLARLGEEEGPLDRTFRVTTATELTVTGDVVPVPGRALTDLIHRAAASGGLVAGATSTLVSDPRAGADAAVDGDMSTSWIAAHGDRRPALTLRWREPAIIDSFRVRQGATVSSRPQQVTIRTDGGSRSATLDAAGWARFASVRATRLRIGFPTPEPVVTVDPRDNGTALMPVGVAELEVPGLQGRYGSWSPTAAVRLPCGAGPTLMVDGRAVPVQVTGDLDDLRGGSTLSMAGCAQVRLQPGRHRLRLLADGAFEPGRAALLARGNPAGPVPAAGRFRPVSVRRWSSTERSLSVAPGAATVLTVHENYNRGWRATLAGATLPAVRTDGWQQGFLVPAGAGGTIELRFTPQRIYAIGLVAGFGCLLLLLLLAALPARRRLCHPALVPARACRTASVVGGAALFATTGPTGLAVVGAVLVAAAVARRRATVGTAPLSPPAAGTLVVVTGCLVALHVGGRPWGVAATSATAQLVVVGALALAWFGSPLASSAPAADRDAGSERGRWRGQSLRRRKGRSTR